MMIITRKTYTTDLSNAEWHMIEPLLPKPKHVGRKITTIPGGAMGYGKA